MFVSFAPKLYNCIKNNGLVKNTNLCFRSGLKQDVFEKTSPQTNDLWTNAPECKSEVMKKLYSPEYYRPQSKDFDNSYRTTLIDKTTNKPVEAIVERNYDMETEENEEIWIISVKEGDKYRVVGERSFEIDKDRNVIAPGYMDSPGNDKYAGIGLRCHQLAVERMIQEGFDTVELCSSNNAHKYHEKCGFSDITEENPVANMSLQGEWLEQWKKMAKAQPILLTNE